MREPTVFVGTMFAGEGDFDDCVAAVGAQVGVRVKHVVIAGLGERDAHNALWEAWNASKNDSDMFAKVDADTVLSHPHVLRAFYDLMSGGAGVTGIQAPLHDYFTDGHINGLNCFSPAVTIGRTVDALFCDRNVESGHVRVIGSRQVPQSLVPAGMHCHRATPAQAFRFGLHRSLKGQDDVLKQVLNAWRRHQDDLRLMALLGSRAAAEFSRRGGFDYADAQFGPAFAEAFARRAELAEDIE